MGGSRYGVGFRGVLAVRLGSPKVWDSRFSQGVGPVGRQVCLTRKIQALQYEAFFWRQMDMVTSGFVLVTMFRSSGEKWGFFHDVVHLGPRAGPYSLL